MHAVQRIMRGNEDRPNSEYALSTGGQCRRNVYSRLMEVFATGVRRSTVSQDLTDARTASAKHGERLMTRFAELAGWRLTLLVRNHVERQPWASDAEPARVSDVWAQVAADIAAQEGLVEEVYGNEDVAESEAKASAGARRHLLASRRVWECAPLKIFALARLCCLVSCACRCPGAAGPCRTRRCGSARWAGQRQPVRRQPVRRRRGRGRPAIPGAH